MLVPAIYIQFRGDGNLPLLPNSEVVNATGEKVLQTITIMNCATGEKNTVPAKAVFVYIGQVPGTTWLNEIVFHHLKNLTDQSNMAGTKTRALHLFRNN